MAVLAGALESVRMHLHAEPDLEATDNQGRSPLILAVSKGHRDICRLLLQAGADPTTKDNEGNDALERLEWRDDHVGVRGLGRGRQRLHRRARVIQRTSSGSSAWSVYPDGGQTPRSARYVPPGVPSAGIDAIPDAP